MVRGIIRILVYHSTPYHNQSHESTSMRKLIFLLMRRRRKKHRRLSNLPSTVIQGRTLSKSIRTVPYHTIHTTISKIQPIVSAPFQDQPKRWETQKPFPRNCSRTFSPNELVTWPHPRYSPRSTNHNLTSGAAASQVRNPEHGLVPG